MSDVGSAIDEARAEVNAVASEIFTDLCDIVSSVRAVDSLGGTTETLTTTSSNVPCSYKSLSGKDVQAASSISAQVSHKIKLPSNAATQAIGPTNRINVHARGNTPALNFRAPIHLDDASSVFVFIAAELAK